MKNKRISVAVIGDVLNINTWSNTPYFFYKAGEAVKLFNTPWRLNMEAFDWPRQLWNFGQTLSGKGKGGYQYSQSFLNRAEAQIPIPHFQGTVISFNQLFPRAQSVIQQGGSMYYYIDITLYSLFNSPSYQIQISQAKQMAAILQEKENYERAEKVVTMAQWNVPILKAIYGLPDNKIEVILPGANIALPEQTFLKSFQPGGGSERPFVLGFIGKDWKRKGLETLDAIVQLIQKEGLQVEIRAIGFPPKETQHLPTVKALGFINKHHQSEAFIQFVQACDMGCLFSEDEALGISPLEFIRLGVPVTGYAHQGMADTLFPETSLRFNLTDSVETMSKTIADYIKDSKKQQEKIEASHQLSQYVTWERSVFDWNKILL